MIDALYRPVPDSRRGTILAFAIAFGIFSYAVLSFRTEVLLGPDFPLVSARRFAGTVAGAFFYWIVLRWLEDAFQRSAALNPLAVIATVLPASIFVLAARLVVDPIFYLEPLPIERNIRWVLVWAGYFGMWVSAALAFQVHRQKTAGAASIFSPAAARAHVITAPADEAAADVDTAEWLVDAVSAELGRMDRADRAELARRLIARHGYHLADGIDDGRNARADLIWRIVARLRS